MDARTTPFTRMHGLAAAYRADSAMLASLDRGDSSADRILTRLARVLGQEPAESAARAPVVSTEPLHPS